MFKLCCIPSSSLACRGGEWNFLIRIEKRKASYQLGKNTGGAGDSPLYTDAEARRYGDQIGLDTQVVHTVNYVCQMLCLWVGC
jgi:hypothetical protein